MASAPKTNIDFAAIQENLARQFRDMEADGSSEPEPAAAVLASVRRIKKVRRAT